MTQNCCDLLKIFKVETFNHQIRQLEFFDIYMYSELYLDKFNSNMKKTFFVMGTTLDNPPQIQDQMLQKGDIGLVIHARCSFVHLTAHSEEMFMEVILIRVFALAA